MGPLLFLQRKMGSKYSQELYYNSQRLKAKDFGAVVGPAYYPYGVGEILNIEGNEYYIEKRVYIELDDGGWPVEVDYYEEDRNEDRRYNIANLGMYMGDKAYSIGGFLYRTEEPDDDFEFKRGFVYFVRKVK